MRSDRDLASSAAETAEHPPLKHRVQKQRRERPHQRLRRLRLVKYAKALATHPFQMDLAEYGRAKAVEWAYRVKNAFTTGGPINAGLKKAS